MDSLPWWAFAGLAFLVLHHPSLDGAPWGANNSQQQQRPIKVIDVRHLGAAVTLGEPPTQGEQEAGGFPSQGEESENETQNEAGSVLDGPEFNISISCLNLPFLGRLVEPCGNVSIGRRGLDVKIYYFGTKHIPGSDALKPEVKSFERYTAYIVAGAAAFYVLVTLAVPSRREAAIKNFKDMLRGKLEEDDPALTHAERENDMEDRKNPQSENFIAPGNIYRLLAVLHPGKIGFQQWSQFAFKAGVCAYMQLYLPCKIISNIFAKWSFNGIKSPLWALSQGGEFVTMFISVGSLCNLFASKCAQNIATGAEANFYILTHTEDFDVQKNADDNLPTDRSSSRAMHRIKSVEHGELSAVYGLIPQSMVSNTIMESKMITLNEYFWCLFSMTMNIMMSFLLFFAMFFKIATFTGQVKDVALVAVSLYFVFDLDGKVMDSDPKLRPKYRHAVLKQTLEKEYKPQWLLTVGAVSKGAMGVITPVGLMVIVLISWKSDDYIIGGDPF